MTTPKRPMTLTEFLRRLRRTPRDWFIAGASAIRRQTGGSPPDPPECPVSSLLGLSASRYHLAARRLKMRIKMARDIVVAADLPPVALTKMQKPLRQRILEACGLKEKS
jgi:hypothetical protein